MTDPRGNVTTLTSPGWPGRYSNNLRCEWLVSTDPGTRVQLNIFALNLESSYRGCPYDRLTVYDGMFGTQNWNKTGDYCRRNQRFTLHSSGSYMKIVFTTDSSISKSGFFLRLKSVCGGYVSSPRGYLTSPGYPSHYPNNTQCNWVLRMRPATMMQFQFTDLDIAGGDTECSQDSIVLRNGERRTSPLFLLNPSQTEGQNGHLCGAQIPAVTNTSSNTLSVSFTSDGARSARGFKLKYKELTNGCGGRILLSSLAPQAEISSPGYPEAPPQHTECVWTVIAPHGDRIHMEVNNLDVKPTYRCTTAGLELRDGGTQHSNLIGKFCRETPHTQETQDNVMYVRFFTGSRYPNNGFKATVKIGVCGGTRYLTKRGSVDIKSPDYPSHYPTNTDCLWTIQGPAGHYLSFSFVSLDLPNMRDCSGGDYVQVQEDNVTTPILATLCGQTVPPTLDTFGNNVRLLFHSDGNQQDMTGFVVRVTASIEECGGDIEGTEGTIQSPGYPTSFAHRHSCTWRITAPLGRKITLTFTDFDLEQPFTFRNRTACRYDWLMVSSLFNAPNFYN